MLHPSEDAALVGSSLPRDKDVLVDDVCHRGRVLPCRRSKRALLRLLGLTAYFARNGGGHNPLGE